MVTTATQSSRVACYTHKKNKRRSVMQRKPKYKIDQKVYVTINPSYVTTEEAILEVDVIEIRTTKRIEDGVVKIVDIEYKVWWGVEEWWKNENEIYPTKDDAKKEALPKAEEDVKRIEEKLNRYKKVRDALCV